MADKSKESGKPTKDEIVKFIKSKNYNFISSRMLARDYFKKKRRGKGNEGDIRGMTHYMGGILAGLKDEGILVLINKSAPSMKYKVDHCKLLEEYNSIPQSSPQ